MNICENGHEFEKPERVEDSTDVCWCCPVKGCTAGRNWRGTDNKEWAQWVKATNADHAAPHGKRKNFGGSLL